MDVGELITRQVTVRDLDGNLTAATMAATTTKPDGATAGPVPTVTNPSTGVYRATWTPDTAGMWRLNWSATGGVTQLEYDPYVYVQPAPVAGPPPFAPAEVLRSLAGLDSTKLTDEKAYEILHGVSADIRDIAGWSISEETAATFVLDGPGSPYLFLPTQRLTAVTSVTDDGTTVASGSYEWSRTGLIHRTDGAFFTRKLRGVVVVATHGWPLAELPRTLRAACLEHALRRVSFPDGITRSVRIDDYAATIASGPAPAELEDDPRVLAYRLAFA